MDPLTHALLGATVGQALCGGTLGKRALLWGAVGGVLPDLDMVAVVTGPMGEFLHHRGPTHSLLLGLGGGLAIGYALGRRRAAAEPGTLAAWMGLLAASILSHPLLDLFTTYGIRLLWPFSNRRFALDAVPIVDPVYTLLLLAAVVLGWRKGSLSDVARISAGTVLALTTVYLFYGLWLNGRAEARARASLAGEGIHGADVRAHPTLLQLYLRRLVVREGRELRVGWLSLWGNTPPVWHRVVVPEDPLIAKARDSDEGRILEWFAAGETAFRLENTPSGPVVEIDDLRYGFPTQPQEGLWGIRFRFGSDGRPLGGVERFHRSWPLPAARIPAEIWRLTFRAGGARRRRNSRRRRRSRRRSLPGWTPW